MDVLKTLGAWFEAVGVPPRTFAALCLAALVLVLVAASGYDIKSSPGLFVGLVFILASVAVVLFFLLAAIRKLRRSR
jgi:hypothetical protein